ncbi:RTJK-like protein, partial [Mya arenaria]
MIRKSKKSFYNDAIKNNKSSKFLWQNESKLIINEKNIEGTVEILEVLNFHFTNTSNIIKRKPFAKEHFSTLQKYLDEKLLQQFNVENITALDVKHIIGKLDISKSTGPDGIGPNMLRNCGDYITSAIASIINNSIESGIFHDKLKEASVVPIHKSGNKYEPGNFRPISILNTLSK